MTIQDKSQLAFDAWFKTYYIKHGFISSTKEAQSIWQAAEAYGREQALEELKAAFLKFENNKFAQLEMVKELIK